MSTAREVVKESTWAQGDGVIHPLAGSVRKTYKTGVYETLYQFIQDLAIPPGERLVEADLAQRFGISKTPIREAILALEQDGLVTIAPHVGATVTWLSLDDFEQLLFLLDSLELPALRLIKERATEAEMNACWEILAAIREAYARHDGATFRAQILDLHMSLFATARYPRLTNIVGSLQRSLYRYGQVFVYPFSDNSERELSVVAERFELLAAGETEAAAATVRQGHAQMFEFARDQVKAREPSVMRYLDPQALSGR